jgi:hypothetical protein
LENIFPMVGKIGASFPMIGKNFRRFSNDWKTFSGRIFGNKKDKKGNKRGGEQMSDNYDNF